MTRAEIEELLRQAAASSKADETFVSLNTTDGTSLAFAGNRLLSSVNVNEVNIAVTVRKGKQYGSASGGTPTPSALAELIARALAQTGRLAEVEYIAPFPGHTEMKEAPLFKQSTADVTEWVLVETAGRCIEAAKAAGLQASGSLALTESASALASSNGLFLYQPSSPVHLQVRVLTPDGASTGFGEQRSYDFTEIDAPALMKTAVAKCLAWKNPIDFEPKRTTTVFEPAAYADILFPMLRQFDMGAYKRNQSFLRKLDGSSFVGTRFFEKWFSLASDPYHAAIPAFPFSADGLPVLPTAWVKEGVISAISVSRYDAMANQTDALAFPTNLAASGGTKPLQSLIESTKQGLLVTGFAPLTVEDPANCLLTGSTRDGLFLIEDGKITKAVKNLVMSESPLYIIRRMEEVSVPERVHPRGAFFPMTVPGIRATDVMYTRKSAII